MNLKRYGTREPLGTCPTISSPFFTATAKGSDLLLRSLLQLKISLRLGIQVRQ